MEDLFILGNPSLKNSFGFPYKLKEQYKDGVLVELKTGDWANDSSVNELYKVYYGEVISTKNPSKPLQKGDIIAFKNIPLKIILENPYICFVDNDNILAVLESK